MKNSCLFILLLIPYLASGQYTADDSAAVREALKATYPVESVDPDAAMARYDSLFEVSIAKNFYGGASRAKAYKGIMYNDAGRYTEALDLYRAALARHILGPDALMLSGYGEARFGGDPEQEYGLLQVKRGPEASLVPQKVKTYSFGGGAGIGVGISTSELYHSGPVKSITINSFLGDSHSFGASGSIGIYSGGGSVSYSRVANTSYKVYGYNYNLGLDVVPFRFVPFAKASNTEIFDWWNAIFGN